VEPKDVFITVKFVDVPKDSFWTLKAVNGNSELPLRIPEMVLTHCATKALNGFDTHLHGKLLSIKDDVGRIEFWAKLEFSDKYAGFYIDIPMEFVRELIPANIEDNQLVTLNEPR
jgi:hypothetical protein